MTLGTNTGAGDPTPRQAGSLTGPQRPTALARGRPARRPL